MLAFLKGIIYREIVYGESRHYNLATYFIVIILE